MCRYCCFQSQYHCLLNVTWESFAGTDFQTSRVNFTNFTGSVHYSQYLVYARKKPLFSFVHKNCECTWCNQTIYKALKWKDFIFNPTNISLTLMKFFAWPAVEIIGNRIKIYGLLFHWANEFERGREFFEISFFNRVNIYGCAHRSISWHINPCFLRLSKWLLLWL